MKTFVLLCLLCSGLAASELEKTALKHTELQEFREAVAAYLKRSDTPDTMAAWNKKFDARVAQKVQDTQLSEDAAARQIAFDWAADKKEQLKRLEELDAATLLEACRLFSWFWSKDILWPVEIRKALSDDRLKKATAFLNERQP